MKQIVVRNIADDLHKDFKVWCATHSVSLNAEIIVLMEKRVGYVPTKRRRKKALTQPSKS